MEAYLYTILIILLGFILIILDIVIIPGGIVGTGGGILILVTIYQGYKHYGVDFTIHISLLTVSIAILLTWVTVKYRLWSVVQHKETAHRDHGYLSFTRDLAGLIGSQGVAVTTLRPAGTVRIDDKKYDSISQGEMIKPGAGVVVTAVSEGQLVVKEQ